MLAVKVNMSCTRVMMIVLLWSSVVMTQHYKYRSNSSASVVRARARINTIDTGDPSLYSGSFTL